MKFLKNDDEVRTFETRNELDEYLCFRKEHDHWFEPRICETAIVGIENFPMTMEETCEENDLNAHDESVYECIEEGNGLFLSFPEHGKQVIYPTRTLAFSSICQRAGLSGNTISNFQPQKSKKVLPVVEKAAWLSRGFSLYSAGCKILLRVELIEQYSNDALSRNYSVSYDTVTESMIRDAEREIQALACVSSVSAANHVLGNLFAVMPRKMKVVSEYLADSITDIPRIVQREYELLDVMKARVLNESKVACTNDSTVLDALDIQISVVSELEEQQIKKFMAKESSGKYKRAFRVRNHRTDERFYSFMKDSGYSADDIHYLYHGSRNENWYGLMKRGPLLAPQGVVINGKMFGNGLYFANRAKKSIGYTSVDGAAWTSGTSSTGFLAVYKVLYNNPLYTQTHHTYSLRELGKHDAVFAKKGVELKNDEIIVFREEQVTLQYIIELQS